MRLFRFGDQPVGALVVLGCVLLTTAASAVGGFEGVAAREQVAQGVTVSGRLVDAYPGAQPQPAEILMTRVGGPPSPPERVPIDPDRTFTVRDVSAGEYRMQAVGSLSTVMFTVEASDVTDLVVEVTGQIRLQTSVRMDDGSTPPPGVLARFDLSSGASRVGPLVTRIGLPFTAGSRPFFVVSPRGYHVVSVSSGGVDLLRHPLVTRPGDLAETIDVVLSREPGPNTSMGRLSGTISGHPGLDVEIVNVTSMPASPAIAGTATTDHNGRFEVEGLTPGIYQLNAPPAEGLRRDIVVLAGETSVENIDVPQGARLFGMEGVRAYSGDTRRPTSQLGDVVLVAERDGNRARLPILYNYRSWGALPPGSYRMSVDGLPPGFSMRSFSAGSVNLLEQAFSVPPDRPAETIRLDLTHTGP